MHLYYYHQHLQKHQAYHDVSFIGLVTSLFFQEENYCFFLSHNTYLANLHKHSSNTSCEYLLLS